MSPSVSAVIVNFNGIGHVEACLHSLLTQISPPDTVTVVDNASTDGSPELIQSRFPAVRLVRSSRNLGYAAACNLGWREAPGDLVVFLNNDLTLAPDWLRALRSAATPEWAFWASRIVFADNPDLIDSAGDGMAVVGAAYKIGHRCPAPQYQISKEVFGACGAAAMYRRELLEETGGFDEDFFLIYEDADLNFRARLLGYRCLYVPAAVVYHDVNRSIGTFSETYVYYGHRNSEWVFWKNMPGGMLLRYLPERLLFDLLSLVYFGWRGRAGPFLRSKLDCVRGLRRVLRQRRAVQSGRRIGIEELRSLLERNWFSHRLKKRA